MAPRPRLLAPAQRLPLRADPRSPVHRGCPGRGPRAQVPPPLPTARPTARPEAPGLAAAPKQGGLGQSSTGVGGAGTLRSALRREVGEGTNVVLAQGGSEAPMRAREAGRPAAGSREQALPPHPTLPGSPPEGGLARLSHPTTFGRHPPPPRGDGPAFGGGTFGQSFPPGRDVPREPPLSARSPGGRCPTYQGPQGWSAPPPHSQVPPGFL